MRQTLGPVPMLLELLTRPEGPIAIEDPRLGSFRLLVDAGVYFEFIPAIRANEVSPPRFGMDEVRLGVPYELVLTAPSSTWAGRADTTLVFDRLDPPLVRVLTPPDPVISERLDAADYAALSPADLAGKAAAAACADTGAVEIAAHIDVIAAIRQFEVSWAAAVAPFGKADNFPRAVAKRITEITTAQEL